MSRLEISPDEFRRAALHMAELASELLAEAHSLAAFPRTSGEETERLFHSALPEAGLGVFALDILPDVIRHSRPPTSRFFGYVLGSGEPVAAAADLLASVLNQNLTAWRSSPAAVTIERTVVEWLAQAIGCAGFTGSLTGGGSSANLMGLAMAREAKAPANEHGAQPCVVYASDEVHMSIPKAIALLGMGRENLRLIPTDQDFRMSSLALERAIHEDRRAGKRAIAIVASAGTVNTGAIDPLKRIAEIARGHGLWLHVDGAYGALSAIACRRSSQGSVRLTHFPSIPTSGCTSHWIAAVYFFAMHKWRVPLSPIRANTPARSARTRWRRFLFLKNRWSFPGDFAP
jgi:aromatic-L-amino-acid decarboxylase